jgi:hypothetical protein
VETNPSGGFLDFTPETDGKNLAAIAQPTPIGRILVNFRGLALAARQDMEGGRDMPWRPGKQAKYVGGPAAP